LGAVWIDPVDKQSFAWKLRLAEGFKMAGGLLLSLRPAPAWMEQNAMTEGVWLPRFAQVNLSLSFCCSVAAISIRQSNGATTGTFGRRKRLQIDTPKPVEEIKKP